MEQTNRPQTLPQTYKPSKIVGLIKANRMNEIAALVPNSVSEILDSVPICVLRHDLHVRDIQKAIEFELLKTISMLNVANNMKPYQVAFTAETIISTYPAESLEDIILCLRRGAMGYYGSTYHQFDTSIVISWIQAHIDEKCNYLENGVIKTAEEEKQMQVDYEAFKKRIAEKQKEEELKAANKRENDIRYFVDKNGGRRAFTVPIEDEEGNEIGVIENVYAENAEQAKEIVLKMIERGNLKI